MPPPTTLRRACVALAICLACDGASMGCGGSGGGTSPGVDSSPETDGTASEVNASSDAWSDEALATTADGDHPVDARAATDGLEGDAVNADAPDSEQPDAAPIEATTADVSIDASTDVSAEVGSPDAGSEGGAPLASLCAATCAGSDVICADACVPLTYMLGCGASTYSTGTFSPCWLATTTPTLNPSSPLPNAKASCAGVGRLSIASCLPGFADCDGNATNGCEANLQSAQTCAACSAACAGGSACSASGCISPLQCPMADQLCGGSFCTDISSDPLNCGACSNACHGDAQSGTLARCTAAGCSVTCAPGSTMCGSACADLQSDPTNCGSCNHACPSPTLGLGLCLGGTCEARCQPGWLACGNACTTPQTDPNNCGGCGHACSAGDACVQGACTSPSALWLATGLTAPEDVVSDGTHAFWTDPSAGTVSRVPVGGGSVSVLRSYPAGKARRVAVDSTNVYWTETAGNLGGAVLFAPKDGSGTPTPVAYNDSPWGVVVTGGYVYWAETASPYRVRRAPVGTTTATTLWTGSSSSWPDELVYDGLELLVHVSGPSPMLEALDPATGSIVWTSSGLTPDVSFGPSNFYELRASSGFLQWEVFDRAHTLVAKEFIDRTNPPPFPSVSNGIGDACGTYSALSGSISMIRPGWTWTATLISTSVNRISLQGGYVYWTDKSGAVGRVPEP